MNFDFNKAEARMREICQTLKAESVENREALEAEFANLKREYEMETAMAKAQRENKPAEKTSLEQFREGLQNLRDRKVREITFAGQMTDAGTVALNQHDIINSLNEGLGLPIGCNIVGGVTGNDLWPVSVNDVDLQEVGENVALTDASFDFGKITPLVKRAGVPIPVSNKAIDNATFDVLGFTLGKIKVAKARYLASRIYSQAAWGTGNIVGPFSGLTPAGTITLSSAPYKAILTAVAAFTNKGLEGKPCFIIDAVTEADLKATLKDSGVSGYIIENGKLAGYDYVVSHYINTKLNIGGTALEATNDRYIGIGYFNYLAVQQHGAERLGLDSNSTDVMIKNEVRYVYNTEFSITDLSKKLNAKNGTTTQAFALYTIA